MRVWLVNPLDLIFCGARLVRRAAVRLSARHTLHHVVANPFYCCRYFSPRGARWGSREVADEYTGVSDELKEKEREFDANGRMIAALIVIGNLLLCVFVLSTVGNSLYLCVVVFFVFGFALFHEVFSLIYVLWHLANRWTSQILWDQCCSTRRNRHVANHYEHTGYRLIPGNDA